jgi:hypothetical protein
LKRGGGRRGEREKLYEVVFRPFIEEFELFFSLLMAPSSDENNETLKEARSSNEGRGREGDNAVDGS